MFYNIYFFSINDMLRPKIKTLQTKCKILKKNTLTTAKWFEIQKRKILGKEERWENLVFFLKVFSDDSYGSKFISKSFHRLLES